MLRPGTAFSVRLRSWWRRSSRLLAYGRARTTAEECSSPTKTLEAEAAAATAPWCRAHTHAQTHSHTHVQTYTRKYHTQGHTHLKHKHRNKHTSLLLCAVLSWAPCSDMKAVEFWPSPLRWALWGRRPQSTHTACVHTVTTFCTLSNIAALICKMQLSLSLNGNCVGFVLF